MDQELISYLDARFQAIEDRFQAVEETIRHTDIKVEGLRGDIRLVADGVAAVDQKLDAFRVEVAREFEQVRAENRASLANHERRVAQLERRAPLR